MQDTVLGVETVVEDRGCQIETVRDGHASAHETMKAIDGIGMALGWGQHGNGTPASRNHDTLKFMLVELLQEVEARRFKF